VGNILAWDQGGAAVESSVMSKRSLIKGIPGWIDLSGETVLVTGGARRIGRAIAVRCARAGANVAFTYLDSERDARATLRMLAALDVEALAIRCDVRDRREVQNAVKETIKALGRLDVLVNNAGRFEMAAFADISPEQWNEVFTTNVMGPFLMSQAALPELRKRQGRIVNIGSLGGVRPWATHAHYCASKAALHMLTQGMAKAMAPEVAVNCVAPGMVLAGGKQDRAMLRRVSSKTPMKRGGTPEEVAEAVLFFATGPHFITGQVLAVDGGLGLAT
jgi:NAD(P)-dependent dehydrogenase (short-subunit alcohol dehydrogenase family)